METLAISKWQHWQLVNDNTGKQYTAPLINQSMATPLHRTIIGIHHIANLLNISKRQHIA